ncbi:lipopolysaccharide biosynthesis protein [Marinobacter sp. W-8]|uniref:lipopolysaccharide biosynthesis protein n=1 Tax=Marinobacter sp. W-8 TaxID=3369658 RepID=UPI0037C521F8
MIGPIARGTIRTSLVFGLRLAVQAGNLLIVARMLGPGQFGAFVGFAALALILGTLSTFGTHLVLLKEVSLAPERREDIFRFAIPTTLIFGAALLFIYLLASTLLLHTSSIGFMVLLAIGVSEIWLQPVVLLIATEHLALGRTARSQLLTMLPLALRLLVAATVFLSGINDSMAAYGFGYWFASLVALLIASRTMPVPFPKLRSWKLPSKSELRSAWGYAALNITAAGPSEFDKTLAFKLLPPDSAGLYAAGARVIGATMLPVMAMILSALPRLFREGQDESQHTNRLLRWIFATSVVFSLVLVAIFWLLGPVFAWLFGTAYHGVEQMIQWLTFAIPAIALRLAVGSALMAAGKPWMRVSFEVTGLVVLAGAAVMFTEHFGTLGMALALGLSEWIMVLLGMALTVFTLRHTEDMRDIDKDGRVGELRKW